MKRPNFFILGAPKCGTTSLAAWLAEHPNVFMSPAKEPHYFNTDHKRSIVAQSSYEALFQAAGDAHTAIGEASVWYLYSRDAVKNIEKYASDARYIVMLRNPIEMAPSLHEELVFTGDEKESDFAAAWELQEERRSGRKLPTLCWEPQRLFYGDVCRLGAQLERLVAEVGSDRTLFVVLDDVQKNAREQYSRVLDFLHLPNDQRQCFPVHNTAKARRWPILTYPANLIGEVKLKLGITRGLGIWRHIDAANRIDRGRPVLAAQVKDKLKRYFAADIALLETILRRDLRHWLA